jgi:hypothetical protein
LRNNTIYDKKTNSEEISNVMMEYSIRKIVGNIDFISAQLRIILEKQNIIVYESSNYSDVEIKLF